MDIINKETTMIPIIPIPIVTPVTPVTTGSYTEPSYLGPLIILCVIIGVPLLVYYIVTITELCCKSYNTKKEFLKDLIPFGRWIRVIVESYRHLK